MSRKQKKICTTLIYIEHFLNLAFTITGCISISTFASFLGIPIGIASLAIGLKICAITAGIKKYKSIIKKKQKKYDKIVLLAKSKLNSINVLISKALIDSVINHDEFCFNKQFPKRTQQNERRNQTFKDLLKFIEAFSLFIKQCYDIV